MTTTHHRPVDVGFLERNRRVGAALTLVLLVGLGVLLGGAIGMLLTQTVQRLLALFAGAT